VYQEPEPAYAEEDNNFQTTLYQQEALLEEALQQESVEPEFEEASDDEGGEDPLLQQAYAAMQAQLSNALAPEDETELAAIDTDEATDEAAGTPENEPYYEDALKVAKDLLARPDPLPPPPPEPEPAPPTLATQASNIDQEMINSLSDLCLKASINTTSDYLMLATYFLTYFEGEDHFTIKRINSLLIQSGLPPVNHGVLETTVTEGFLLTVPDMTGMAEVTEYALTEQGQAYTEGLMQD
jgi:hypothetical protein